LKTELKRNAELWASKMQLITGSNLKISGNPGVIAVVHRKLFITGLMVSFAVVQLLESAFKKETVGLVTREQFVEKVRLVWWSLNFLARQFLVFLFPNTSVLPDWINSDLQLDSFYCCVWIGIDDLLCVHRRESTYEQSLKRRRRRSSKSSL